MKQISTCKNPFFFCKFQRIIEVTKCDCSDIDSHDYLRCVFPENCSLKDISYGDVGKSDISKKAKRP